MKALSWLLISSRVATISCGLTFLAAGCGGENKSTVTGGTLSEEEKKRNDESKNAMEAASKSSSPAKKR